MKELVELREKLCDELKEYGKKGDLSAGTLTVVDTLAHSIKNIDKILDADEGYSGYYPARYAYDDGLSRRSYARDRMGRYSRTGLADKLRDLMDEAPDDHTRMEIKRLVDKM